MYSFAGLWTLLVVSSTLTNPLPMDAVTVASFLAPWLVVERTGVAGLSPAHTHLASCQPCLTDTQECVLMNALGYGSRGHRH